MTLRGSRISSGGAYIDSRSPCYGVRLVNKFIGDYARLAFVIEGGNYMFRQVILWGYREVTRGREY